MLMGFYSIIVALRRLTRPGVSIEMRKLFIKKHALYVFFLIIIWLMQLLVNYNQLFKPPENLLNQKQHDDLQGIDAIEMIS